MKYRLIERKRVKLQLMKDSALAKIHTKAAISAPMRLMLMVDKIETSIRG